VTARLHVLLGAGGVGKTTLAAGYALALARAPDRHVGLLGIDPSRRLKDALHVALGDMDVAVPGAGALRAAVLQPAESVRRWVAEACPDPQIRERLFGNPFFAALADRLATATDIFAAARVAEWAERDPGLTDLVVDTAPGLNAIEFLTRPERVATFLGGRLVGWLRWLAPDAGPKGSSVGPLRGGAGRIVGGLERIGGSRLLSDLADFFALVQGTFTRMIARVQATERWLHEEATQILVVTSVRHDGAETAKQLLDALSNAGLVARAVVVNRALPIGLAAQRALIEVAAAEPRAVPVIRYALAYSAIQERVVEGVQGLAARTAIVPDARGLDGDERLEALARIGTELRAGLE
jgi:anion-transporting  ArsA/GET3 family ATPase